MICVKLINLYIFSLDIDDTVILNENEMNKINIKSKLLNTESIGTNDIIMTDEDTFINHYKQYL